MELRESVLLQIREVLADFCLLRMAFTDFFRSNQFMRDG
jgi:hypothetical protein